jgi:hypothetical protein
MKAKRYREGSRDQRRQRRSNRADEHSQILDLAVMDAVGGAGEELGSVAEADKLLDNDNQSADAKVVTGRV